MISLLKNISKFSAAAFLLIGNVSIESNSIKPFQLNFSMAPLAFACPQEGECDDDDYVEVIEINGSEYETDYDDNYDIDWDDLFEAYIEDEFLGAGEVEAMQEYSDCMRQAQTDTSTCEEDKLEWVVDWHGDCLSNVRVAAGLIAFINKYAGGSTVMLFGEACDDYRDWGNSNVPAYCENKETADRAACEDLLG
jgi:hypothetical protein